MRKLPLLLALLLLSVLLTAASAQASFAPTPAPPQPFAAVDDEEDEAEEDEAEESEDCVIEDEEDVQLCAEIAEEEREEAEEEQCVLDAAKAAVTVNPGKRRLRLTVHYKTLKPATVDVEASLQGPKGAVHLGTEHARFRRSGTYRDTFTLPEKQMKKALAAREFSVDLHVVNAPASCGLELTGASPRARR
ncbi:MAG TPA: hypothetical protein VF504_02500 [Solirubrobacterales bacterium]